MRVTKSIKNFINTEVAKRLMPKYQAEREEAERQTQAYENFLDTCFNEALTAYNKYFDAHFAEIADFVVDQRDKDYTPMTVFQNRVAVIKKSRLDENNVHWWERRYNKEVEQTVERIVVELELGGTKTELMEMLDKIGKGE